jgi:hypothetical protein
MDAQDRSDEVLQVCQFLKYKGYMLKYISASLTGLRSTILATKDGLAVQVLVNDDALTELIKTLLDVTDGDEIPDEWIATSVIVPPEENA